MKVAAAQLLFWVRTCEVRQSTGFLCLTSDLSPPPRIIPFQRPLKIKELLQKVTEAFGQQMDMYFKEKEVQKGMWPVTSV